MKTQLLPTFGQSGIIYSQYARRPVEADQCVALHGLSYLLAGSLRVMEVGQSHVFGADSLVFSRKNFLAEFIKQPAGDAPFRVLSGRKEALRGKSTWQQAPVPGQTSSGRRPRSRGVHR